MKLNKRFLMMMTALCVGLSVGWVLPAQQAASPAGPQWKDRAEYDLADAYTKATDAKGQLAALDKWKQAYPDTEMWQMRSEFYLSAYTAAKDLRHLFDTAKEIRVKQPNNYWAITTILSTIYQFPAPPAAADLTTAEQVSKYVEDNGPAIFAATNKPANLSDAQWGQNKPIVESLAMRTYAWVFFQRKDDVRAEQELTKVVQADPTQAQFSYMLGQSKYNQRAKDQKKVPDALFHVARAAEYDGPNAIPAAQRPALLTFVTNSYTTFHGSKDGLDDLLKAAKVGAMPPAGFTIVDANTIQMAKFKDQQDWDAAHPDLVAWRDSVKGPLTGPEGAKFWKESMEGAELPGASFPGVPMFKGTIISMDPMNQPTKLVVAVFDSKIADATLTFDPPLPGTMDLGSVIQFSGVADSYTADPFNVTFKVDMGDEKEKTPPKMTGWTGVDPPGTAKQKAKGPAAKGKAGAKAAPKAKQ